jgi:hypothetical protein
MEKYTKKELKEWLEEKARETAGRIGGIQKDITGNVTRKTVINFTNRSRDETIIGKMYFFRYDPKWKTILPKYDKFPMAIPIEMYANGFLGLNLHYLNVAQRDIMTTLLLEYKNNKYMDERTRMRINYDIITASRKLNGISRPCIHRYLYNHCMSKFIEIYPDEWDKAIALPTEDWVFRP